MDEIVTLDSKIDLFRRIIIDEVEERYNRRLTEIDKQNEEKAAEYEREMKKKSAEYLKERIAQAEYEKKMILSKAKANVKQDMLHKRAESVDILIGLIKKKAWDYTLSDDYESFLSEALRNNIDELRSFGKVIVSLDIDIFDKSKEILSRVLEEQGFDMKKVEFEAAQEDLIGGVKFYNENKTIRVDESFATLIEDNKKVIGQYLFDMMNEAGEVYE